MMMMMIEYDDVDDGNGDGVVDHDDDENGCRNPAAATSSPLRQLLPLPAAIPGKVLSSCGSM